MPTSVIRNETSSQLTLVNIDGEELVLAPLQKVTLTEGSGFHFEELERKGLVRQFHEAPNFVRDGLSAVIGVGFWLAILAGVFASGDPIAGVPARWWPYVVWSVVFLVVIGVAAFVSIRVTNSWSLVRRFATQTAALIFILAIGIGFPLGTIYYFGGGRELLSGMDFSIVETPPMVISEAEVSQVQASQQLDQEQVAMALFGRMLQLVFISLASMLPVLMFFLFDRFRLQTLRHRLYKSLFRMDDNLSTVSQIEAKYGAQIMDAFGTDDQDRGRLSPGSRLPVMVCALIITIGWIIAIAPVGTNFHPSTSPEVLGGLLPQPTPMVFGFLGVYVFTLQSLGLRYVRGDLKPKAYTQVIVRAFVVAVLSWVLAESNLLQGSVELVVAFLIGYQPENFFTLLRQVGSRVYARFLPPKADSLKLDKLDGIDVYDLARLEGEGITNIEALAHHEIVDLVVETRIPVSRLVDWVDQAILYLHLDNGDEDGPRARLGAYGVRTASHLNAVWAASQNEPDKRKELSLLLNKEQPFRLEIIRDAMQQDELMHTVICWRANRQSPPLRREAVPTTVSGLLQQAKVERTGNRDKRALKLLRELLQKEDNAAARSLMAQILTASHSAGLQDPAQAKVHADRALELAPDDYTLLIELAGVYHALSETESMRYALAAAAKIARSWQASKRKHAEKELALLDKQFGELKKATPSPQPASRS